MEKYSAQFSNNYSNANDDQIMHIIIINIVL